MRDMSLKQSLREFGDDANIVAMIGPPHWHARLRDAGYVMVCDPGARRSSARRINADRSRFYVKDLFIQEQRLAMVQSLDKPGACYIAISCSDGPTKISKIVT